MPESRVAENTVNLFRYVLREVIGTGMDEVSGPASDVASCLFEHLLSYVYGVDDDLFPRQVKDGLAGQPCAASQIHNLHTVL